jgi:staphylococcal nuclease domain-containing protein 1
MAASTFEAKVKSVLSGDTVILHNINNPKQERTLSLAFVTAPRLKREGDEQWAFESRDYLRKLLVGKVVRFQVLYKIPTGANREYGLIVLPNRVLLPETAVAEGWLKLRDDAGRKEDSEEAAQLLERLQAVEARARADSKGMWAESGGRINSISELSDAQKWVDEHKGQDMDAIVEKVLSGDRLIVRFLLSPTEHVQTMVLLAGVRAPATQRTNPSDGKVQPAEAFGDEAQQFVETRLLQRSATVNVLGTTPNGQIVADVKHPDKGSITPFLLKAGLAKCTDHHTTLLGQQMGVLRAAEKAAKDARVGLYQGHVAPKSTAGSENEAVVSRVQSADTLFLRNKAGVEKRINLSSVRQPKPTDPKQSPWVPEAKEFLRKKLIGKHVKFHVDGKRPATEGYEEREMATVTFQNKNVGLMLVENGMATVIRHRQDDADRSPVYDDLLLAEQTAQEEQKGLWSPKAPSAKQYVDYSESLEKAKRQLSLLSRQKKVPAVVDFVKSASRFTVLVPRENAKLTFVLSGIRAPRSARNDTDKGEPFGKEAHEFANKRCQQRDVEIDVEDCDKVGGFIGTLYINRENFAKTLVEEGLASVHAYSAEKAGNANELFAAERRAKEGRKGLWHDWDPSQDEEAEDTTAAAPATSNGGDAAATRRKDYRDVIVTHVEESGRIKFQEIGSGTSALTSLMSAFSKFHLNPANSAGITNPKAGEFVAAKFTADDQWYRARIRRNDREAKKAEVVYVDYGNSELIPWSRLRPLSQTEFLPSKLQPQAKEAQLAFIQLPQNPEYLADAVNFISQETADRQLVANVDQMDKDGTLYVTLFDPKTSKSPTTDNINADVIDEGLAMVPKKLKAWERSAGDILAALTKKQDVAKEERRGQWEYGDLSKYPFTLI